MHIEIINGNIFESYADTIILTVDGASKGMEGNIAHAFQRHYPDVWEEFDVEYPIALGTAKIYPIDEDLGCSKKFCIFASTVHHLDTLEASEKLHILSAALRHSLVLASQVHASSVCTAVLAGGWRLDSITAFDKMVETYNSFKAGNVTTPSLSIYVLGTQEFSQISQYCRDNYHVTEANGGLVLSG